MGTPGRPPSSRPRKEPLKRLFTAIELPVDVGAHLAEFIDARLGRPELRWVPPARWHLTLEFLGACGRHEQERQLNRWAVRSGRARPFEAAVAGGGAFPGRTRARVLWAGVDVDTEVWRRLAGHDQQPHVTVARSKEPADLTGLVDALAPYRGPAWTVDEIVLMESHLRAAGERGPRYEVLERFPLN